jgi:hypothetical protein
MQGKANWFWLLLIPVLISVVSVPATRAQVGQRLYFSETGHWVLGDFLIAYQSVADPGLLYGMPITDEFTSQTAGERRVQYFEHARFELRPENPPELRVVKSELGQILYNQEQPGAANPHAQGDAGCQTFQETGFRVCTAFLDFFEKYGGIDQFGYPISDLEEHDTFTVQYFQFARLEYHPELPAGEEVVLTDVGRRYFTLFEDPRLAQPVTNGAPHLIMELQVQAFVSQPVMLASGEQTVYVVVQDQSLAPVPGAKVIISIPQVALAAGKQIDFPDGITDDKGIARLTFPLRDQANGVVEIMVLATYEDLKAKTITSYRVWW